MMLLLDILDWIFVFVLGLPVLYLFVFAPPRLAHARTPIPGTAATQVRDADPGLQKATR